MRRNSFIKIVFILLCLGAAGRGLAVIAVMGDLSDEREVSPGQTYNGVIVVRNLGDTQEEIKVYATDYRFFCDGSNFYEEPGKSARSNAGWVTFSPKRVFIPPKEDIIINFTVQVPQSDSLRGTYWSVLMVEPIPKTSLESNMPERTIGITSVMRYAIQIVSNVGESGFRKIRFFDSKIIKEDTTRIFEIDVENVGERMLKPEVMVQLFNSQGTEFGPFKNEKRRIYPNCSVRHKFDFSGIPKGVYKAIVVADCGDEDLFGVNYTFQISD
jgi:hypothetical protein